MEQSTNESDAAASHVDEGDTAREARAAGEGEAVVDVAGAEVIDPAAEVEVTEADAAIAVGEVFVDDDETDVDSSGPPAAAAEVPGASEDLVPLADAWRVLGVSDAAARRYLRRWLDQGRLAAVRRGRSLWFRREDLEHQIRRGLPEDTKPAIQLWEDDLAELRQHFGPRVGGHTSTQFVRSLSLELMYVRVRLAQTILVAQTFRDAHDLDRVTSEQLVAARADLRRAEQWFYEQTAR